MNFPTDIDAIEDRLNRFDPSNYAKSRNYLDGNVSYLSPYIARGVISTKQVADRMMERNLPWYVIEKFIQELAWRDYWQLVWKYSENSIDEDFRHVQKDVSNHLMPQAIQQGTTGIAAVDAAIAKFYETGYMHNHMRMYVASICCNIAKSHWSMPAKWLYAHLLDGDAASNQLSWQWVAGTFSGKKYYANQENINRYCHSNQKETFLDVPYEAFDILPIPDVMSFHNAFSMETSLGESNLSLSDGKRTLIYNYYNLDAYWHAEADVQRVLLLEPSHFEKYPISKKCFDFMMNLSKNIMNIQVFVGEFEELKTTLKHSELVYKEHPTCDHYQGTEESRTWLTDVTGTYNSFFAYWKRAKKQLRYEA
ncbi:deoxyribodipyrimidine photolyase [Crocinitomicaceae bacterium]|nr:deoxyribodipyrimidine photolyase [Crocinitomicaceae bacterium]